MISPLRSGETVFTATHELATRVRFLIRYAKLPTSVQK